MSQTKQDLKFILSRIRHPSKFYWGIFAIFISSVLVTIVPYIYGSLVDLAIDADSSFVLIIQLILLWTSINLIANVLERYSAKNSYEVTIDLANHLTTDLYAYVLNLPISFHKRQKTGKMLQKINNGVSSVYTLIDNVLFSFAPTIISFFVALAILFWVEWRLSTILFVAMLIFVIVTIFYTKKMIKVQVSVHQAYERAYGYLFDSIVNARTVKSNTSEDIEEKNNKKRFNLAGYLDKDRCFISLKMGFWQKVINVLSFSSVLGLGIIMLRNGELSPGKLVMFVGYISLLSGPLDKLASQYRYLYTSLTSLRRAISHYKIKKEEDFLGAKDLDIKGNIEFRNVDFYYKKTTPILKDISFEVKYGEKIALVGESGVGKTTLVDLIERFYLPRRGKILINGVNIKKIKLKNLRNQIAIVPQEVALFNNTIKQNIRYGKPDATDEEIEQVTKIANASEFIERFPKKYNQVVGERGIKLSTGQKQRVAIARALLRNPKILILDEATSALDSVSEKLVQEGLNNLMKNRTCFIIAHRLSTIKNADKILVLKNGTIAEMGKHEELIKKPNGTYREFWVLQSTLQNKS